jgi:glycosyltransferase involved in cell wall biosynthesis
MRILFVNQVFLPSVGGSQIMTFEIAKRLVMKGHKVTVITVREKNYKKSEVLNGINVLRVPMLFGSSRTILLTAIPYIIKCAREADIIHAHQFFPSIAAYFVGKLCKKPVILQMHEVFGRFFYETYSKPIAFFSELIEKITLRLKFDKIICNSKDTLEGCRRRGASDEKLKLIRLGVDYEFFEKARNKKNRNSINIGYLGRLGRFKGILIFLEAALEIIKQKRYENINFIIAGEGPLKYIVKQVVSKHCELSYWKLPTEWFGNKEEEKLSFYANIDIFVNPSLHEGFGLTVLEAMASGCAIIVSDTSALPELIENLRNGLVFKTGDSYDLADKIRYLIENWELTKLMMENNVKKAEKMSWETVTDNFEKEYNEIVKMY